MSGNWGGRCTFVDKSRVQLNEVIPLWLSIASFQGASFCHFLIGESLSRLGSLLIIELVEFLDRLAHNCINLPWWFTQEIAVIYLEQYMTPSLFEASQDACDYSLKTKASFETPFSSVYTCALISDNLNSDMKLLLN